MGLRDPETLCHGDVLITGFLLSTIATKMVPEGLRASCHEGLPSPESHVDQRTLLMSLEDPAPPVVAPLVPGAPG